MQKPDICISYSRSLPEDILSEFTQSVKNDKLKLLIETRETDIPWASLEWLIPTGIIVYIAKSYFDSFLKEMGKDHYNLLKLSLIKLKSKLFGQKAPKVTKITSAGKSNSNQPYSLLFSIMAEGNSNFRFKLLIQNDISDQEYKEMIEKYMELLKSFHDNEINDKSIKILNNARIINKTILLSYNKMSNKLESLNPLPNSIKP